MSLLRIIHENTSLIGMSWSWELLFRDKIRQLCITVCCILYIDRDGVTSLNYMRYISHLDIAKRSFMYCDCICLTHIPLAKAVGYNYNHFDLSTKYMRNNRWTNLPSTALLFCCSGDPISLLVCWLVDMVTIRKKRPFYTIYKCKLTWTRRNELSFLIRIRGSIELLFLFIY